MRPDHYALLYLASGILAAWLLVRKEKEFWAPPVWCGWIGFALIALLWPLALVIEAWEQRLAKQRGPL